jgi:hypothetical protein
MEIICKSLNGVKLICLRSPKGKIFSKLKIETRIDWNELLKKKCYEVWLHTGKNPERIIVNQSAYSELQAEKVSEVSIKKNKPGLFYESIPVVVK